MVRDATPGDVAALAQLHVTAFRETHGGGPPYEIREQQWRKIIGESAGRSFCLLVERPDGGLAGFARGIPYTDELPGFDGELNKLYVLREYHRRGLGRRLVGHVARRFLSHGIGSMLLFGDAQSPSNGFYEALGAERLITAKGEFHGGYGWRDLQRLAAVCPAE